MKKWLPLLFLALLQVHCTSSSTPQRKTPPVLVKNETPANSKEAIESVVIEMTIEGMVCAMGCAAVIEKKLNKTAGITKATVDFPSKKALVEFNRKALNSTQIVEVVKSVGEAYSVSTFSITKE